MSRFRSIGLLLSVVTVLATVSISCGGQNGDASTTTTTPRPPVPAPNPDLREVLTVDNYGFTEKVEELRAGQGLGVDAPLVMSLTELVALHEGIVGDTPEWSISARESYLVLPFIYPTGGYDTNIIELGSGRVVVSSLSPCPEVLTTQALTGVTLLVPVDASEPVPEVQIKAGVRNCPQDPRFGVPGDEPQGPPD